MSSIDLDFGALAPLLKTQLQTQGRTLPAPVTEMFQDEIDAATRLYVRSRMSRGEWNRITERIGDAIARSLKEYANDHRL